MSSEFVIASHLRYLANTAAVKDLSGHWELRVLRVERFDDTFQRTHHQARPSLVSIPVPSFMFVFCS